MRLLVVDDHPFVREALVSVLAQLRPEARIDQAGSAREMRDALRAGAPVDLVLLDLRLPDAGGLELLEEIARQHVGTAVAVLSGDLDPPVVQRALALGAAGCIPKAEPRDVLVSALGLVLAGGVYVPRMALAGPGAKDRAPAGRDGTTPRSLGLTERQLDVLALLMQGKNNKLICRALGLAEPTVKNHVSAILRALDVDSRTEAVLAVGRLGWTLPDPTQPR